MICDRGSVVPEAASLPTVVLGPVGRPPRPDYTKLSSYTKTMELQKGRFSTVWSATCKHTDKLVVIKAYVKQKLKPRQLLNVQREIALLRFFGKIRSRGVVRMLASFEDTELIHLVFEACMGGDLYKLLVRQPGKLTEEYICTQVVEPLLCILHELHALDIIHRDIKPENIFLASDGSVRLGDFGFAVHKTQDFLNERAGTLDYMSPEVLSMPVLSDSIAAAAVASAAAAAARAAAATAMTSPSASLQQAMLRPSPAQPTSSTSLRICLPHDCSTPLPTPHSTPLNTWQEMSESDWSSAHQQPAYISPSIFNRQHAINHSSSTAQLRPYHSFLTRKHRLGRQQHRITVPLRPSQPLQHREHHGNILLQLRLNTRHPSTSQVLSDTCSIDRSWSALLSGELSLGGFAHAAPQPTGSPEAQACPLNQQSPGRVRTQHPNADAASAVQHSFWHHGSAVCTSSQLPNLSSPAANTHSATTDHTDAAAATRSDTIHDVVQTVAAAAAAATAEPAAPSQPVSSSPAESAHGGHATVSPFTSQSLLPALLCAQSRTRPQPPDPPWGCPPPARHHTHHPPCSASGQSPSAVSARAPEPPAASPKGPAAPYDEKVDVWAVGILVYELMCGRTPFEVEDQRETATLILTAPVTNFPPTMSRDCRDFVTLALHKDPSLRPSAKALLSHPWLMTHHNTAAAAAAAAVQGAVSEEAGCSSGGSSGGGAGQGQPSSAPLSGMEPATRGALLQDAASMAAGLMSVAAGGAAEPQMPTMLRGLTPRRALSVGDEPLLMEQPGAKDLRRCLSEIGPSGAPKGAGGGRSRKSITPFSFALIEEHHHGEPASAAAQALSEGGNDAASCTGRSRLALSSVTAVQPPTPDGFVQATDAEAPVPMTAGFAAAKAAAAAAAAGVWASDLADQSPVVPLPPIHGAEIQKSEPEPAVQLQAWQQPSLQALSASSPDAGRPGPKKPTVRTSRFAS
ncbi:MAG: hypothetical protein WDW36_004781 [Sanguina aurantia]